MLKLRYITVIKCKSAVTLEMKLKEEQLGSTIKYER